MTLDKEQRRITSEELIAHFEQSSLTEEDLAHQLNISVKQVEKVLNMDASNGFFADKLQTFIHLVWDIRDAIDNDIRDHGEVPSGYTYLQGEKEDYWFLQ
ncbi:DUF2316 family protein [Staphylococcus kloosii]|jgi:hypothetical protein|uniref:DUF2316 family protein n=1 Tax=Staphylococcus kloosii TaxID=29384 RepID=UPI000D1DF6DE|nr:DUF2316 family protein [Staphylococcus kloosii]PTJ75670.1 DUF2316 domain-containing protein [Staphylococcus kloosii]